jgi:hypothetical protein
MYIRGVQLENLRGFESLEFDLERPGRKFAGWTVIVGDNGSGKSAFLKAVALCLVGPDVARSLEESMIGWVRQGAREAALRVQLVADEEADRFREVGRPQKKPFWAELEIAYNGDDSNPVPILRPARADSRRSKGGRGPIRGPWAESPPGWFCAGYGPFRRLGGSSSDAARLMGAPGAIGRFVTMFREDAALSEAELWLKELRFHSYSGNARAGATLAAVTELLNDGFLHGGLRVDRVDPDGVWLRDTASVTLPMRDMSDGYRAALGLVVDIVRHMADVYGPDRLVERTLEGCRVARPGVILIDEIDVHLHPEWQRSIGAWLKGHFPYVQFIVATHSPFIAQEADERMVFCLPAPGTIGAPCQVSKNEYERIQRGRASDVLTTSVFGLSHTRSLRAVAVRQRYSRLSAKKQGPGLTPEEERQLRLDLVFVDPEDREAAGEAGDK